MNDQNYEELKEQLEQYKEEKERVRKIVGQIGGRKGLHYQKVTNQIFLLVVILNSGDWPSILRTFSFEI